MKNVNITGSDHQNTDDPGQEISFTSHISLLVKIIDAVKKPQPYSIITRESEHPNRSKYSYIDKTHIYSTSDACIDRNIFDIYFSEVVFNGIQSKLRSKNQLSSCIIDLNIINSSSFSPSKLQHHCSTK